ncbi:MAG: isoprenylcysteine carboxylmethyltransferase family protein [Alicyclobacillus sp.]|nr:isoprenylcysteine carboxylmethyltransferase family protein [Alicyclobacillus sp.]
MVHGVGQDEYGLWTAVIFDVVVFALFTYSAFKPQTKRDWRTLGVFWAFLVALFSEMFRFPLTIYILTSVLGKRYPVLDPFSHYNSHLLVALLGGSPILFTILHLLSNLLIFAGLLLIAVGWRRIHAGGGRLVTGGIYRLVRHPQYSGFMLMIVGFLIQWPTLITLIMAPMLLVMYTKLAKKEEQVMIETFSDEYLLYMNRVPRFVPRLIRVNEVF